MKNIRKKLLKNEYPIFSCCLHGLERESLRIQENGHISLSPHPKTLGSAFRHPYITTDFSEAQIEYSTVPYPTIDALLKEMELLCHYVRKNIDSDFLWPYSMPPQLPDNKNIPIANYGNTDLGRKKHIYRRGLANRYGAKMQCISGLHYNFSFTQIFWEIYFQSLEKENSQENRNLSYLHIIRNLFRYSYIFPYLFGNSNIVDSSYIDTHFPKNLETINNDKESYYSPLGTSLRMSEIGYNHPSQWHLCIQYNSLEDYLEGMHKALHKKEESYTRYSVENEEQLSYTTLQIENEHYAFIRPKPKPVFLESPNLSLKKSGIDYIEIRSIDIDSSLCCGTDKDTLQFLHLLLIHTLLENSPPLEKEEQERIQKDYLKVVWEGRNSKIKLQNQKSIQENGIELCHSLEEIAKRLDQELKEDVSYINSLKTQKEKFKNNELIPSKQSINELENFMLEEKEKHSVRSFLRLGCKKAKIHTQNSKDFLFPKEKKIELDKIAKISLIE